jgi:hypothetical protein
VTRPDQLRRVFVELKAVLPDEPAWRLLKLAAYIVKAHREPEGLDLDGFVERTPFFSLDVVKAIEDGGWRVLEFERWQGMSFGDEISDNHHRTEARLRNLLGRTSWPRSGTD